MDCAYFNHPESQSSGIATQELLSPDKGGGSSAVGGQLGPEQPLLSGGTLAPLSSGHSTTELEMMDLELLHHFTTSTYRTISTEEDIREVWRLVVPRIALSHEFLMHAVLAMSALHLSALGSRDKPYAVAAAEHHSRALGPLRAALPVLSTEHANALMATSSLTALYAFACRPGAGDLLPTAPTWIPLFRGIMETIYACWNLICNGELMPLWGRKDIDKGSYDGEDIEFPSSLFDLSQRGTPGEPDPKELEDDHVLEVYHRATEELKNSLDLFRSTAPRVASAFAWPCSMQDELLRFIEEQRPRALVLVAHHCVILESVEEQYWWVKGRGVDELRRIEGVLDEKWKRWLEWPMAKCKISKGPG